MQTQSPAPLQELGDRFLDYLPTLAAGLLVLAVGIAVGWLAKRATVRVLVWLRLDRLGGRYGWRAAFGKGDVRAALYELIGNGVWALLALVFLDNALQIWQLDVLSRLVDQVIIYVPNLLLVALIVTFGMFLSTTVAARIEEGLEEEGAGRPGLVAKIVKAALMTVVAALALWQLNFAREIVLAAFLIGFGAVGVAFAVAVGLGSSTAIRRGLDRLFDEGEEEE